MGERLVQKGSSTTLVGYPRLRGGELVQAQPTGTPRVKVRTPAQPDPAFANCELDDISIGVAADAAAGDTELTVAVVFDAEYDVAAAEAAVSAAVQAFGFDATNGDLAADTWLPDDPQRLASVAAFRTIVEADAGFATAFGFVTGSAITSDDYDDIVAAFASVAEAAPTWVKNRRYLVTDDGYGVVVESRASGQSTTLRLAQPLTEAIAAGATVEGFAVLVDVDDDATANEGECSIEWEATVDGEFVVWADLFRIVARIPKATLTTARLLRLEPAMRSLGLPDDYDYKDAIAGAWEKLQGILENNGVFAEEVVSDEALAPLHALQVLLLVIEGDPRFATDFVERQQKRFTTLQGTTFNRVSYAEASQSSPPYPRDPTAKEDRGNSIRLRR